MSILTKSAWRRSLGEGVVIVLGVLVALAVDDWHAGVQQGEREAGWVTGLRDDLIQDRAALDQDMAFLDESRRAITEFIATLDDASYVVSDTASYLRLLKRTNLATFFSPTATTYTELTAGGGVSAISNRQLMRAVIEYHQSAMLTDDLNGVVRQIRWYDWYDAVTPLIDPTTLAALTEDWYREVGQWPPSSISSFPEKGFPSLVRLRSDEGFRNALAKSLDAVAVQYGDLYRMRLASDALLELVQTEAAVLAH